MKKGKLKIKQVVLVISLIMITSTSFAQTLPGFDDTVDDTAPAPISSLVALGLIAGAAYGIRKMK